LAILGIFLVASIFIIAGNVYSEDNDIFGNDYGLLSPMKPNAYGPGIHSDATGRPFKFKTFDGQDVSIFKVKPNNYGPGGGNGWVWKTCASCTFKGYTQESD